MFIEMSYSLSADMPVFPGSPEEEFMHYMRIKDGDICNSSLVHHFLHNGTHVDAPLHFDNNGKTIEQIPINDFYYNKPLIINKKLPKGGLIQPDDLVSTGPFIYQSDILLLCTGYYRLREDKKVFMDDFPALSAKAAKLIREELLNVKAIAIDSLSIESSTQGPLQDFSVHKTLLSSDEFKTRPVLIFEDVNIGAILDRKIRSVFAFPIRLHGLEAAPVSMVAEVD